MAGTSISRLKQELAKAAKKLRNALKAETSSTSPEVPFLITATTTLYGGRGATKDLKRYILRLANGNWMRSEGNKKAVFAAFCLLFLNRIPRAVI